MKHKCENLQKVNNLDGSADTEADPIEISIRKDDEMVLWQLSLFSPKKLIAMGVVILHCPFCGKELGGQVIKEHFE